MPEAARRTKQVLLVEDEAMIAMLIEDMLAAIGCEVAATAATLDEGIGLAREQALDLAILDVNLDGVPSYPIAEILRERAVPVIFATGYGTGGLDPRFAGAPTLQKPFLRADLERAVNAAIG